LEYRSFSDVERLDADALKTLLIAGEPPERVWAAWALGLRHHQAFARELRATAAEEPHAGVRRHLVVVLAGAGERQSVLTMAAHDPDERVRATALQYVARLAQPKDDDANDLLARTMAEGTPLLRLGCIAGLRPDARPGLWNAVDSCVASPDRDLRWAAYEAVMRQGASARSGPELTRTFLDVEPERPTRVNALQLLLQCAGVDGLRQLIGERSFDATFLPEVVEAFHQSGVRLEWVDVERLIERFPDWGEIHRALQLLAAGGEGAARSALLGLFVAERIEGGSSWEMGSEILTRLRNALDQNRGPLDEPERRLREALAEQVERAAHAARDDQDGVEGIDEEGREILARLAALEVH
jgi:hypothetical protein